VRGDRIRGFLKSEDAGLLLLALLCTVGAWLAPGGWHFGLVFSFLCVGIFFDLISLALHVSTLVTKKYSSGFPVVGAIFYAWFILTSRFSLVGWGEEGLARLLLYKVGDAALLLGFHILCHLPMRFQRPRDEYD